MTQCTLQFPNTFNPVYKEGFCQLYETQTAFPWSEYSLVTGAKKTTTATHGAQSFSLDTTAYTNHPSEIYINGGLAAQLQAWAVAETKTQMVGVSVVENIGNGDQSSFWNSNAKYGNLYLITTPGMCQDFSPKAEYTSWRLNDFDLGLRNLAFKQDAYNGTSPSLSVFGFPTTVQKAKKEPRVVVTILPGPSATHVPDGEENKPGAIKQGEWPLAWSSVTYTPAKPIGVDPTGLIAANASQDYYCSRVMQGYNSATPIIQFHWNAHDLMAAGATLTVAHDINDFKAVLRGDLAKNSPSIFKITLSHM